MPTIIFHVGSLIVLDGKTWKLKGLWHKPEDARQYGYDFWYQYKFNTLISTEWGNPSCWWKGFDPAQAKTGESMSDLDICSCPRCLFRSLFGL